MKRNTWKRLGIMTMAAMLLAQTAALTGCGNTATLTDHEKPSEPSTTATTKPSENPIRTPDPYGAFDLETAQKGAKAANQFGYNAIQILAKERGEENYFVSTLSLYEALALLSEGMGEDCAARSELLTVLGMTENGQPYDYDTLTRTIHMMNKSLTNKQYATVNIANSAWIDSELQLSTVYQNFEDRLSKINGTTATIDLQSMEAVNAINQWASDQTNGMIKEMNSEPFDIDTVLVLLNAVYFYGSWDDEFHKDFSSEETFHGVSDTTVWMMHDTRNLRYLNMGEYHAVSIPYKDGEYSMNIYMTVDEKGSIVSDFAEEKLSESVLQQIMGLNETQSSTSREVALSIPRFELEDKIEMNQMVKELGANEIFHDAQLDQVLDLTQLQGKTYVSDIFQKTKVKVNEEGTEAAAVTEIICKNESIAIIEEPISFTVDHPFVFTITDEETGAVVFLGSVSDMTNLSK